MIGANAVAFVLELVYGNSFVLRWSLVPHDVSQGRHLETFVTALFMHASWSHIIGNMIFLWAFGPQIEDAMNPLRFTLFYLVGGVVSMGTQIASDLSSTIPDLGASGAIAAVMGAFLITYPRDKIRTILFLGWFFRIAFLPAAVLIGFWFVSQLIEFGAVTNVSAGGVAYLAHIGGMVFGALLGRAFEDPARIRADTFYSR